MVVVDLGMMMVVLQMTRLIKYIYTHTHKNIKARVTFYSLANTQTESQFRRPASQSVSSDGGEVNAAAAADAITVLLCHWCCRSATSTADATASFAAAAAVRSALACRTGLRAAACGSLYSEAIAIVLVCELKWCGSCGCGQSDGCVKPERATATPAALAASAVVVVHKQASATSSSSRNERRSVGGRIERSRVGGKKQAQRLQKSERARASE